MIMRPSGYAAGLAIVLGTAAAAALLIGLTVRARPPASPPPAAQDLSASPRPLGDFALTERSGRTITAADLADRVWVASFIFTRCRASCPRITSVMKGLQDRLGPAGVRLVSISVDPEHDTPTVLSSYARTFGADPQQWWFLTGPQEDVYRLILDRFGLGVAASTPEERQAGAEEVSHSRRLALVDRGNRLVGYYDSDDPQALAALRDRALRLARPWVAALPAVNATLNALSTGLLLLGWTSIRLGRHVRAHRAAMIAALVVSTLFLACYLAYHAAIGGGVPYRQYGPIRLVYFTILLSHVILAAALVPLVLLTVSRALRGRFAEHASIARVTFPVWLYVAVTGVVVYLMLYQPHLIPL